MSWYDSVYRPIMEVMERHHIPDQLPRRPQADLYLALTRRWLELRNDEESAGPEGAGVSLLHDAADSDKSALTGMVRRWVRQHIRHPIVLRAPRKD